MSKPKRAAKRTRRPDPRTAPKKKPAPKRAAPKKKAARVSTVDAYVRSLPPAQQPIVTRLRALIAATSPEAIEAFKWGQPVYEANGPFAYIKAHRSSVNFGFWRGSLLEAPAGLLQGAGTRMRHLKLTTAEELDEPLLTALIQMAVLLNSRLGNPTRR